MHKMKRWIAVLLAVCCLMLTACSAAEPPGGLLQLPSGGEEATPSGGEETTPSGGEETTPSGGEETKPSGGEGTTPSGGEGQPAHTLTLLSVTSPIKRGSKATVEARGEPGVEYDIAVCYSSGESSAQGLENKTADAEGLVSWTWRVGGGTKAGTYTIRVTGGGATLEFAFTVTV